MLAYIKGTLASLTTHTAILEVQGVGYLLQIPQGSFADCSLGSLQTIYTRFIIHQEQPQLFGFAHEQQRTLFDLLVTLPGIGPKTALHMLGTLSVEQFADCIQNEKKEWLQRVPGIGKKTAERIILELKDKIPADWLTLPHHSLAADAIAALVHLGYPHPLASKAVHEVADDSENLSDLISKSLKQLCQRP